MKENHFQKILYKIREFFHYFEKLHSYKYILEGEASHGSPRTILIYRARGKRDIFELSAQDICYNSALIKNFHPLDVRIIAYISGIEQVIETMDTKKTDQFTSIKNKMFSKQ